MKFSITLTFEDPNYDFNLSHKLTSFLCDKLNDCLMFSDYYNTDLENWIFNLKITTNGKVELEDFDEVRKYTKDKWYEIRLLCPHKSIPSEEIELNRWFVGKIFQLVTKVKSDYLQSSLNEIDDLKNECLDEVSKNPDKYVVNDNWSEPLSDDLINSILKDN